MIAKSYLSIFIIFISLSVQDQVSDNLLQTLQSIQTSQNTFITISKDFIKAKRQKEQQHQNNFIYKSMENLTVETFWRYPKPILRREESVQEEAEEPQKKIAKKKVPNFMKPLEKDQDKVVVKKEKQKHEQKNEEFIVPGNLISVEEAFQEHVVQERNENYQQFINKVKFVYDFMFVDLEKYTKFNYVQLGSPTKYHDFKLIDRKDKFHDSQFPNIQVWLYSQEDNLNFYFLRVMVNNEYRFFNEFKQEKIMSENKGSFFGPRIANCWNDYDILSSYNKAKDKFVTMEDIQIQFNGQTFEAHIKKVTNTNTDYLTIKVNQNDKKAIKQAKREYIDKITTMQLSKQQLNKIGYLGRFNKDDKCFYDLNFESESSNLELTFMFKIIESDWSRLNAVYTGYKNNITENCQIVQNDVYDNNYFGQRMKKRDIEVSFQRNDRNFYLKAFKKENKMFYIVVYDFDRQYFLSENVYENALKTLKNKKIKIDGCLYHNDNYMLNRQYNELYLITFYSIIEEKPSYAANIVNNQNQDYQKRPNQKIVSSNLSLPQLKKQHFSQNYQQSFYSQNQPSPGKNSDKLRNKFRAKIDLQLKDLQTDFLQDNFIKPQKIKQYKKITIQKTDQNQDDQNLKLQIKKELKTELKKELKTEIIQELKEFIENKRII